MEFSLICTQYKKKKNSCQEDIEATQIKVQH